MRIEIPTGGKAVKDPDIRALYLLDEAMKISTDKMVAANLRFIMSKHKKKIYGN